MTQDNELLRLNDEEIEIFKKIMRNSNRDVVSIEFDSENDQILVELPDHTVKTMLSAAKQWDDEYWAKALREAE
jgi:hypothetical protein